MINSELPSWPAVSAPDLGDKTLLVLGSTGLSKPGLFKAAGRRGVRLVLVKRDASWEKAWCDDVLSLDCVNYEDLDRVVEAIVQFASHHRVDGVITTFDAALPALAEVASRMSLVGVSPSAAAFLRNKILMRRRFEELGLPSARNVAAQSWPEVAAAAERIGFPVVVKPIMGTGSAGVVRASEPRELRAAFDLAHGVALRLNGTPELLVEEYLDGIEITVDALVHRGSVLFHNITDNPEVMPGPVFEEFEFVTPTGLPEDIVRQVYEVNLRTLHGLGLTDAVGHTEIRVTSRGPRLIEIHPRVAGQRVPEIIQQALGVDLFGSAIDIALGLPPAAPTPGAGGFAGYRCVCPPRSGTLQAVHGIEEARRAPGVFDVELVIPPGSRVTAVPDAVQQNIAFILAHGDSYAAVRERTAAAQRCINLDIT